jgi:sugar lactone lactonase YvrE
MTTRYSALRVFASCVLSALAAVIANGQAYYFTTLTELTVGSRDGTGSAARFSHPDGVAIDDSGNVYVADSSNGTIRKITPDGVVTTFAGSAGAFGSADGTGGTARFSAPAGIATDHGGNVYVSDGTTIRKITPDGVVRTFAGIAGTAGSADGIGSAARFSRPSGVATGANGDVYVADTLSNTIRRITPDGTVMTLAGTAGLAGEVNGLGAAAQFYAPTGLATDTNGNVFVADSFNYSTGLEGDPGFHVNTIRKITPAGLVTTLAGSQSCGTVDGLGSAAQFLRFLEFGDRP